MSKKSKDALYEFLYRKYGINKIENEVDKKQMEQKLKIFVEDLYDISKVIVVPLSKNETFLFRNHYEIFDNNIYDHVKQIETLKIYNLEEKIKRINTAIKKYIKTKLIITPIELSIFDLYSDKKNLSKVLIAELNLSEFSFPALRTHGVQTIGELLRYDKKTITNFVGAYNIVDVSDKIHKLGLKFIDEISDSQRKQIFEQEKDNNKILNSDISWLGLPQKTELYLKKYENVHRILDLYKSSYINHDIINKLEELGLQYLLKEISALPKSYNLPVGLANISILNINLSTRSINCLINQNIYTLGDLMNKTTKDLLLIWNVGPFVYSDIIKRIHDLGLYFIDEKKEPENNSQLAKKHIKTR